MLRVWLTRLRFLVTGRTHREVDEELQFHLEQQVEANIAAGMTPEEARRQAAIAFGGVEYAREECREARPGYLVEMLLQDVRYGWRQLTRGPRFSLTVIVTLAVGLGATAAMFTVVNRVLFAAMPYKDAGRLAVVEESGRKGVFYSGVPFLDVQAWRDRAKSFEEIGFSSRANGRTFLEGAEWSGARAASGTVGARGGSDCAVADADGLVRAAAEDDL